MLIGFFVCDNLGEKAYFGTRYTIVEISTAWWVAVFITPGRITKKS